MCTCWQCLVTKAFRLLKPACCEWCLATAAGQATQQAHKLHLHELLVLSFPLLHFSNVIFESLDQIKVIVCDVIVVVLDLSKGTLMLLHEFIDVCVLSKHVRS